MAFILRKNFENYQNELSIKYTKECLKFISSVYLFYNVDPLIFETNYISFFTFEKIKCENIIKEKESIYYYIVNQGKFEVFISKSLLDIQDTLKKNGITSQSHSEILSFIEIESIFFD